MGSLSLPSEGAIYMDASAFIYSAELQEPYLTILAPAWQHVASGRVDVVCSELVITEILVRPLREGDKKAESERRAIITAPYVRLVPPTRHHWEIAARLRAEAGLKTPDALHAATALRAGCQLFITNDSDFRRVPHLPVVVLDDLIEK